MPTGRFVLRAYSRLHDTQWQREWTESQKGIRNGEDGRFREKG